MTRGVLTAWLSVDEQDAPAVFEAYLCFAFRQAGLDTVAAPRLRDGHPSRPGHGHFAARIEAHDAPCVLALDEVERLSDPGSVALLNLLLERGPPNLHLAIACRDFPSGLEIGTPILEGRAVVVTAAQLRFSAHETAAFSATVRPRTSPETPSRTARVGPSLYVYAANGSSAGRVQ